MYGFYRSNVHLSISNICTYTNVQTPVSPLIKGGVRGGLEAGCCFQTPPDLPLNKEEEPVREPTLTGYQVRIASSLKLHKETMLWLYLLFFVQTEGKEQALRTIQ